MKKNKQTIQNKNKANKQTTKQNKKKVATTYNSQCLHHR